MVVYGFGAMSGGPIIGFINDKLGGGRAVSKASIVGHIIIYGSLIICNELHTFNIMCFISGFLMGAADSSQMTQLSIIIANEFTQTAQPYALLNFLKCMTMSAIMIIGSFVSTKEAYRIFFLAVLVVNILS